MAEFKLTDLVTRVDQDKLLIPDFQRGFKWQTPTSESFLSPLLDFPIGAALLWRTQRTMLDFRRIEDVEFADGETDADENFQTRSEEPRAMRSISSSTDSSESRPSTNCFQPRLNRVNTNSTLGLRGFASSLLLKSLEFHGN